MADSPIQGYLIAGIVLTLIIVGGINLIGFIVVDERTGQTNTDFSSSDNTQYIQFNKTFNKLNDVNTKVGALSSSVTNSKADVGLFGFLDAIIGVSWNTLKNIGTSFSFIGEIFTGLNTFFGIPSWVTGLILSIIGVVIVFAIFMAVFRIKI